MPMNVKIYFLSYSQAEYLSFSVVITKTDKPISESKTMYTYSSNLKQIL